MLAMESLKDAAIQWRKDFHGFN